MEKEDTKEVADDKHYISMYILARERYNWASQKQILLLSSNFLIQMFLMSTKISNFPVKDM